ncbi:MAG: MerR family transcriptional regulator [Rikenellaceae bacterium]|nr:MerR family transcriptional regulator [Rikenellaceae bacterium]
MAKKMFYSMGEVAEMFDVKPSLLRHWEAKFDILRPHKNKKGNRMFTPEDVENLKLIYHLVKERGMTLAGAAQYLKNGITDTMRRDMELLDRLQKIRAELVEVREQLKDVPDGYTVVEVAQPEEEIVIEEPTEEAAPEVIEEVVEEVIEEIVEPIDDEEDEVEIEELVELIIDEEEEEIIEEELTEEPIEEEVPTEEEPTEESTEEPVAEPTEVQPEESKEEPTEDEPTDSTPRPRGAKGGRRSKKQEAKLFEVKPEKQRPIAPFFDQTLF